MALFYHKKNSILHLIDASTFFIGISFCSYTVIFPSYVKNFTDNSYLLMLIPIIWEMGMNVPQIFSAYWSRKKAERNPIQLYFIFETIHRVSFIVIGVFILILGHSDKWALISFYAAFVISNVSWGMSLPQWTDTISITVPDSIRAKFMGTRDSVARLVGAIFSVAVPFILLLDDFPNNYGYLLIIGGVLFSLGGLAIRKLEPIKETNFARESSGFISFFKKGLDGVFQNKKLRPYLFIFWALGANRVTSAYHTPYIMNNILVNYSPDLQKGLIGALNTGYLVSAIIASVVMGYVIHHFKHKVALSIVAIALAASNLLVVLFPTFAVAMVSEFFFGLFFVGLFIVSFNTVMDYTPEESRSHVYAVYCGLNVIAVLIYSAIGSVLTKWYSFREALIFVGGVSALLFAVTLFIREKPADKLTI